MRDFDSERQRLFTRRTLLLGGLQAAFFGGLVSRMYYLQVTQSVKYTTQADENRISVRLLAPPRGLILDRMGLKLAINEQNFRLLLTPEQTPSIENTLTNLSKLIPFSESALKRIHQEIKNNRPFNPVTLAENLSWDQVAALQLRLPELEGVSMDVGQIRYYPFAQATAHILGYVGAVSKKDLEDDDDPLLSVSGLQIGKSGIEKTQDKTLRGRVGAANMEVNAYGRVIREIQRQEGVPGNTLNLTLDIDLQKYAQQRLMTERSAACVVMDVHTGAIYALASHPTFDSNTFSHGITQTLWDSLRNDEAAPLTNKVIAGLYSPGSTFKMVTAMAALSTGHITPAHTVPCMGAMKLGGHTFHCWKHGGHGSLDLVGALRESCDVYFYDLGNKIGIDPIADMARTLGLGKETGLNLPSEKKGLVPDREWKEKVRKERWQGGDTLNIAIGQGDLQTTPLQLAAMVARLVNGGHDVTPTLLRTNTQTRSPPLTNEKSLGFDEEYLSAIIAGMNSVCNDKHGTAYSARITTNGQEMGGKTGTSQVRRISMAERASGIIRNEDREWRLRDNALFVGYAPTHSPRYAVAVIVEHGGGGSKIAAPIARDILIEAQRLNPAEVALSPLPAAELIPSEKNKKRVL